MVRRVEADALGPRPRNSCSKRLIHCANSGFDLALGFHGDGNSATVAKISSTFPKSPGLTK